MEVTRRSLWALCALVVSTCAFTASAQANPVSQYLYDGFFQTMTGGTTVEEGSDARFVWFSDSIGAESAIRGYDQYLTSMSPYPEVATVNGTDGQGAADPAGQLSIQVNGLAFDPNNDWLYVADTNYNRIVGYPRTAGAPYVDYTGAVQVPGPIGNGSMPAGATPGEFDAPQGLAFDTTSNKLFVADTDNGRIQVFDSDGSGLTWSNVFYDGDTAWNDFSNGPTALAIYPAAGMLYSAEYGSNTIRRFSTSSYLQDSTIDAGAAIYALAVDENAGTLLAAASQSIRVFSISSGQLLGTLPALDILAPSYYAGIATSTSRTLYTSVQRVSATSAETWDLGDRPNCPPAGPITVAPGATVSFSPTCVNDSSPDVFYELGTAPTLGAATVLSGPNRIEYTAGMTTGSDNVSYSALTVNGVSAPQYQSQPITISGPTQPPTPPAGTDPPTYKDDANLSRSTGTVLVKLPGSGVYENVATTAAVPLGTVVDAREGVAFITWARPDGTTYSGQFSGGIFEIKQETGKDPYAVVKLRDDLVGEANGGRLSLALALRSAADQFDAYIAAKKGKRKNKVWGNAKGKFRTVGSNSSASVRGTQWLVENYVNVTRTYVKSGVVEVKNFKTKKKIKVKKGQSYYAWK